MRLPIRIGILVAFLLFIASAALATPPQPTYGTANVDGNPGEWNLVNDFFSLMYRAGNPSKPVESRAYLRYDCSTQTMYVLVLMEPNSVGYIDPNMQTAWVAINAQNNKVVTENSGDDGIPPDFEWVGQGYDGDPQHVRGYEASFTIAPGSYNIIFHIDVIDSSGGQTSASPGFPGTGPPLVIDCSTGVQKSSWGVLKLIYR
ncbi:MAG: hypothetical protein E6K72_00370 [Candidatus Eisenbacteria bacterium]|uniref:DUF2271 domain-containing protein n=1 Tax=Eiseniibacteriota bacterium TaxID=2212470 RepID=A0A538TAU2_UNCEI|nr:MAG: hypothetical protein E6K72_00370 [Candidatus Eisenbacteria bacterium]